MFLPFYIAFVQGMNINFTDVFPLWGLIACDVIYIKYSWQSFPITGALLEEINFSVFVIKVLRSGDNVAVGDQGSRVVGEGWIDLPSLINSSEILGFHDFHQSEHFLVGKYKNQANIGWSPLPVSKSKEAQVSIWTESESFLCSMCGCKLAANYLCQILSAEPQNRQCLKFQGNKPTEGLGILVRRNPAIFQPLLLFLWHTFAMRTK